MILLRFNVFKSLALYLGILNEAQFGGNKNVAVMVLKFSEHMKKKTKSGIEEGRRREYRI